ncbi:hypothetical protein ASF55_18835 [Methylobacterium sp. Leaf119]|nr:hypothetical protein ASF55_18835 [Methylobacterium sp. Leaf119]
MEDSTLANLDFIAFTEFFMRVTVEVKFGVDVFACANCIEQIGRTLVFIEVPKDYKTSRTHGETIRVFSLASQSPIRIRDGRTMDPAIPCE